MRKYLLPIIGVLLLGLSCEKKEQEVPVSSVSMSQATAEMVVGETIQLSASVQPSNATEKTVSWASSKISVATVSNGKVTAIAEGVSTITASCGGKSATCQVTVSKAYVAVTSVTLNKTELTLEKGKTETLTATVSPSDATDQTVTWSSSKTDIAIVDANGKVTAVAGGSAIITAKAGDKQATCTVIVTVPVESITLDRESVTLEEGETTMLTATVKPDDATDKTVTWSSSNSEIATVDETGKVTAIKEGEASITAKAGEKSTTCKVTVQKKFIAVTSVTLNKAELALEMGESETLVATVAPEDATDKTVAWRSSDENVATVDNSGKVTAIAGGSATITAKAGEIEAACAVTVTNPNNITFADANLKKALVDAFDTDDDGGLSYEEAAVISSANDLIQACAGSTDYKSFDEFQFFTGIPMVSKEMFYKWKIHSIVLPKSIITIDDNAFEDCYYLESIEIPEGVITIGKAAFSSCSSLKSISLPNGLNSFGIGAFWGCSSLTSIVIPPKQGTIGVMSFAGCENLERVTFLGEIISINMNAFSGCKKLKDINLPTSSLYYVYDYAFSCCSSLESIELPNTGYVGDHAFEDCVSLKNVKITAVREDGTGHIGSYAFKNCTSLTSAIITTDQMSSEVFWGCTELHSIVLNDGLKSIGERSFGLCKALESIVLPQSILYIGNNCFKECSSMSSITVNRKDPPGSGGEMFEGTNNCPIYVPAESVDAYRAAENWKDYADRIQAIVVPLAVDLGLSVKWATCNLSESGFVSTPEEYGDYYAWGEIGAKSNYSWSNYKFGHSKSGPFSKYNIDSSFGTVDNKTLLEQEDDVAHVILGDSWRMPTHAEWTELRENCTWTWTTQNGIKGRLVTGPNGKSIFLPAAGYREATYLYDAGSYGLYWSSELYWGDPFHPNLAWYVNFNSDNVYKDDNYRYRGFSIRPVTK